MSHGLRRSLPLELPVGWMLLHICILLRLERRWLLGLASTTAQPIVGTVHIDDYDQVFSANAGIFRTHLSCRLLYERREVDLSQFRHSPAHTLPVQGDFIVGVRFLRGGDEESKLY